MTRKSLSAEDVLRLALELPEEERKRFWQLVVDDPRSPVLEFLRSMAVMVLAHLRGAPASLPETGPGALAPIPIDEYLDRYGPVTVTPIPEMREAGLGCDGILSKPGELKRDLWLFGAGQRVNKRGRDRKPAPETLARNAELHRLRTENPKKWSWKRLGTHFEITESAARFAFAQHEAALKRSPSDPENRSD
jgi:hypothetical protein